MILMAIPMEIRHDAKKGVWMEETGKLKERYSQWNYSPSNKKER